MPASLWGGRSCAVGNLAAKTDPRGKTTNYTYDNLSRLASETDPLSHVRSYAYDAAGRLTSRTDARSQSIAYTYNDRNELTNITYPDYSTVAFAYNDAGTRTQMTDSTGTTTYAYDSLYRLTSVTFPGSRTVSYGYDDAGRRTSLTYPGGSNQAAYAYDAANRLTSVTDWNSRAVSYAYDDAGRMTTKTLPASTGIVSSYSYDAANRLTGISHIKDGSTTIASVAYTLDAVGNRTQRVDQQGTHTYSYDDLYRLTSVTYPGPSTTSYAFDAFGNRTGMTDSSGTTAYAYDDASRLTSVTPPSPAPVVTYTWDNNGDLTARGSDSFAWDYEDRMTSATVGGVTTSFTYRGDGLRHSRTTGMTTTTFTWDVNAGLPVVLDDGSQYVYGAGLEAMVTGSGTYYYLADGLGSTMAMVDTGGTVQKSYTYDVYGKPKATGALANEFDFAGQQTDPTGLQYLRARYMDPDTGTFVSRDPLSDGQAWTQHPFSYAGANPALRKDPRGTVLVSDDGCGSGDCQGLNGLIPHANNTYFKEYPDGSTSFCSVKIMAGSVLTMCLPLKPTDFDLQIGCEFSSFGDIVSCYNQFGGLIAAFTVAPSTGSLESHLTANLEIIAALYALITPYHDSISVSSPEAFDRFLTELCKSHGYHCKTK